MPGLTNRKHRSLTIKMSLLSCLGRVDELYQAKASGETDDRSEVSLRLFASEGDPFESLQPTEALFDASASLVEGLCEEGRPILFVGLVRDHGSNAPLPRSLAVRLAGIAFVAHDSARLYIRSDIEQGFEVARIRGLAAGQVEADERARSVGFRVDFRRETAARAPERLPLLPPFAPAAET